MTENTVETLIASLTYTAGGGIKTKKDDWDCFSWYCTINAGMTGMSFNYYTGLGHVDAFFKAKKPTKKDVLYALISDYSLSEYGFSDFCASLGYSKDSIKAFQRYVSIQKQNSELKKIFSPFEIALLQEFYQDY